jgi:hypothetical protein
MHRDKRPLPSTTIAISAALAAAAWLLFILVQATYRLNTSAKAMMWILTLGWPAMYAGIYGVAMGMVDIVSRGPMTDQWPGLLRSFFPPAIRKMLDRFYLLLIPTVLVTFPAMMLIIATVMALANFGIIQNGNP